MKKIVIVGAGASGLVASIFASKNNEVILLEKMSDVGKKILVTGNGRCNYFNSDMSLKNFFTSSNANLSTLINEKNLKEIEEFFLKIGIIPKIKNGYYYPMSNQAVSIKNALKIEAIKRGVKIINNFNVIRVEKKEKFLVYSEKETITCDKLILASGSKSYPKTGSDGFGYDALKKFNHNIIPVLPSLVQINTKPNFKEISGVKAEVLLSLFEENKKINAEKGEVLFTDYGLSGICTLNLSSLISKGLYKGKKEKIIVNFIPFLNIKNVDEFIKWIDNRNKLLKSRNISELFDGFINYKLVNFLLSKYKNRNWDDLNNEEKEMIAKKFYNYEIYAISTKDFNSSQVCSGGLDLNEINLKTMESKKVKDLYVTGELLDIDGKCGGYNLTLAWISGMIAGKNND